MADVINPVVNHGNAVHAHTEGPALPLLWIDAHIFQNFRMHHPTAKNLYPSTVVVYIHIHTWFDKSIGMRSNSGLCVMSKKYFEKMFHCANQFGHRCIFTDDATVKLIHG